MIFIPFIQEVYSSTFQSILTHVCTLCAHMVHIHHKFDIIMMELWFQMYWFQNGKGVLKAVYCHPAYVTHVQSTSGEMLDQKHSIVVTMKHKLQSRLPGEISMTSGMQMTPPLWQKAKGGIEEFLDESERGE